MKKRKSKEELDRKCLIKKCIKILNSKEPKVIKIQRYYSIVNNSTILSEELFSHMSSLRVTSFNEFSPKKEVQFLKSIL